MRHPVLILESDDWGADAPARVNAQAEALVQLAGLLGSLRDGAGRKAVMTIGLVSGILDRQRLGEGGAGGRLTLDHPSQAPVLAALRLGVAEGVFAIQWHGLEHYWPQALLTRRSDPEIAAWLAGEAPTESLPVSLQSRWVDAAALPTRPLPAAAIRRAVQEEAALLKKLFGLVPTVAVPNTFVWNDEVERAWFEAGVRFVVTPGARYIGRDDAGRLVADRQGIRAGEAAPTGVHYLVRDVYFEPARGHEPERLLAGLAARARAGRACLVETHRFNYLGEGAAAARQALRYALEAALERHPDLRFASSAELGEALLRRDPAWVRTPSLAQGWARLVA